MPSGHGFLRLVESALRSLTTVSFARLCPSRFHLPIPLRSTGITPLLHYYGDSDASRLRLFAPMLGNELRLPFRVAFPTSRHSNFPPFHPQSPDTPPAMPSLDSIADCRSCLALHGSASGLGLRLWLGGLAVVSGRIEFNMVLLMDWLFASGCSPPRLSTTQLPSATEVQLPLRSGLPPNCWCALVGAPSPAFQRSEYSRKKTPVMCRPVI